MRFGVVVFPGTWSDCDFHYVISEVIRQPVKYVWHRDRNLSDLDCVILPGGFSYGDYLRAGAVAGKSPVVEALREFVANGGYVLGSCNGFQILCEAGLLPGVLLQNESLQFVCRDVPLVVERDDLPFTSRCTQGETLVIPVKHGDGRWFGPPELVAEMQANRQIVLRYGQPCNGSVDDIAGICNEGRNVVGLMPHPERAVHAILGSTDGVPLLQSVLKQAAAV